MRVWVVLNIAILSLVLMPDSRSAAQESDFLVVPGQRVGQWELGKPLDAYPFGRGGHWVGSAGGRPYYDGYSFRLPPAGPTVQAYTCRSNALVFAILVVRRLDESLESNAEEMKYKTKEGIAIGTDEADVVRLLGRPERTLERVERHGTLEVQVGVYEYPGLDIRFNRSDRKVFALGATRAGGFVGCRQAVLGGPPSAQPAPGSITVQEQVPAVLQESDYRIVPGQRVGRVFLAQPIEAYAMGRPSRQLEGVDRRIPYFDVYHYSVAMAGTRLQTQLVTCRDDGRVFAALIWRPVNLQPGDEAEALKYRTAEGIGIGSDESEVFRLLGQPEKTGRWMERHGAIEFTVSAHTYRGLHIQVGSHDRKVFAIGATTHGEWSLCWRKVLGSFTEPSPLYSVPGPGGVAIPRSTRVVPPGPEVPREQALFSGKWLGRWPGDVPHVLVVEEIRMSPPTVIVVYANGGSLNTWVRWAGSFSGRELRLDRDRFGPRTAAVSYRMISEDTLDGTFESMHARMQRVKD